MTKSTVSSEHESRAAEARRKREEILQRQNEVFAGLSQCEQGQAFIAFLRKHYMSGACFKETDRETNYTLGRRDFAALIVETAESSNV